MEVARQVAKMMGDVARINTRELEDYVELQRSEEGEVVLSECNKIVAEWKKACLRATLRRHTYT